MLSTWLIHTVAREAVSFRWAEAMPSYPLPLVSDSWMNGMWLRGRALVQQMQRLRFYPSTVHKQQHSGKETPGGREEQRGVCVRGNMLKML